MNSSPTDQCIVLPFRPESSQQFNGIGLALHFLIGNVLVLHTRFKEMWFGWRAKKIFPTPALFQRYCREVNDKFDLAHTARSQKIRTWIYGTVTNKSTDLYLFDEQLPGISTQPVHVAISTNDNLIGFRQELLDWLTSMGWPMPNNQIQKALWPEEINYEGLDAVGRSLEKFYLYSYIGKGTLDVDPFKKAVAVAPKSFMAQDLYGWALYRNCRYKAARDAFFSSLSINPAGVGAMSGLMWCGVYGKDQEEAMFWSGRKADVCGKDVEAARTAGRRRYKKINK